MLDIKQLANRVTDAGKVKLKSEWEGYDDLSFTGGVGAMLRAMLEIDKHSKNDQEFKLYVTELAKELAIINQKEAIKLNNYFKREFNQD